MLMRIPMYQLVFTIDKKVVGLRVAADDVDRIVRVLMFNGVTSLEVKLEETDAGTD